MCLLSAGLRSERTAFSGYTLVELRSTFSQSFLESLQGPTLFAVQGLRLGTVKWGIGARFIYNRSKFGVDQRYLS